jgi:hypothetical protein
MPLVAWRHLRNAVYLYSMRVRVDQLWSQGLSRDGRERHLADEGVIGYLFIEDKDGERFASLVATWPATPRKEILPRLWSPVLTSAGCKTLLIRGVQRDGGRLYHQVWECRVLRQD